MPKIPKPSVPNMSSVPCIRRPHAAGPGWLAVTAALAVTATALFLPGPPAANRGTLSATLAPAPPPPPHPLIASAPPPPGQPSADLAAVAREAYVWGWPLAYLHQCREALSRVPVAGRSGGMPVAPLNRLSMLADTMAGRTPSVPCPNQDVIYGFGMFDLEATPVVIQVPDFGDRIWLYQLGDQRTDSFASVGCMHGTRPGAYLVAGPGWEGAVPAGIAGVFRCPTRYAYCMPRVFVTSAAGDREAALPAVNRILAYPLAEFDGELQQTDWSRARWLPAVGGRARRGGVTPESLLRALPDILADVPPLPGEEPLYARLRGLATAIASDPAAWSQAVAAAAEADARVVAPLFHFRNVGRPLPGHWTTLDNGGAFGTDYVSRTAAAKSNVFVNRSHETRYYYLDLDADGRRLDGGTEYAVTFPAGSLPPTRGFWSLTVYDERHQLPSDAPGRHVLGSRNPGLELAPDGSLTVTVVRADASAAEVARPNRIVAPPGDFSLYLRIYWPDTAAVDAGWTPPPVRPADRGSAAAQTASLVNPPPTR